MRTNVFIARNDYIRRFRTLVNIMIVCLLLAACSNDDSKLLPQSRTTQTVFMYFPWSSNLTSFFYQNIEDFKTAIERVAPRNERVIVFLSTSATEASMFELAYRDGDCVEIALKNYSDPVLTTAGGITSILNDVKSFSPATRYGMIIGCHGMGWIPVSSITSRAAAQEMHWNNEEATLTRFFGGKEKQYQTDITTLADGIKGAGMKMEYILFDDCYLSTIEVAYDLKDVTQYLIASTSEIMAYGMPYAEIGQYLIGDVDYYGISNGFYEFYKDYEIRPCGTIGVTKCEELDNLAVIMREINQNFTFDPALINSLQRLDGYRPAIFFDYGDYVSKLCTDSGLLARFNAQLDRTVPPEYRRHTEFYYSALAYSRNDGKIKINTYSGITISDPSENALAMAKTETAWYRATH